MRPIRSGGLNPGHETPSEMSAIAGISHRLGFVLLRVNPGKKLAAFLAAGLRSPSPALLLSGQVPARSWRT
jgi:hypothetical protein